MQKSHFTNQHADITSVLTTIRSVKQPHDQQILIFKTNIQTQGDKFYIKPYLDKHPLISQWNIDLEDIDNVLRVVARHLDHQDIIRLITQRGYYCEELV